LTDRALWVIATCFSSILDHSMDCAHGDDTNELFSHEEDVIIEGTEVNMSNGEEQVEVQ
jgi:hypothetical protein